VKGIGPALGKVQLACMDRAAPLSAIGHARKELFGAIREALVECKAPPEYLAKFDKINGE
jgi:hypothetical protein